jgi:nucleotide-binding universal stress UspA family protein
VKILLATDGSGYARIAEEVLTKLEAAKTAEILVATVAQPLPISVGRISPEEFEGADELTQAWHVIKESALKDAQAVCDRLSQRGINATPHLLEGDPGHALLDFAEEQGVKLIAAGSRGMGGFMSLLLGSVARRLVSYAKCSVLIAHPPRDTEPEADAERLAKKAKLDVLVAADGGKGSTLAIEELASYGKYGKGVAVCAEVVAAVPGGINPAMFAGIIQSDRERSEAVARHAAERLASCCETSTWKVELGRPAAVLVETAQQQGSDLIVLGATRHGFFERFLLGSVSMEVSTEASCSVLVVRVQE